MLIKLFPLGIGKSSREKVGLERDRSFPLPAVFRSLAFFLDFFRSSTLTESLAQINVAVISNSLKLAPIIFTVRYTSVFIYLSTYLRASGLIV